MNFIKNLRRRSRLLLENKRTAGILLIVAMLLTILSVRLLKPLWEKDEDSSPDPLMGNLLEGKRAISIVVKTANLPLDVLYPGAKVDVTDIKNGEVLYLAKDVPIAGLSIMEEGASAKVTLAVNLQDSENVIKNRSDTISLVLSGDNNHGSGDIEIVEM
jgi:hypothetical protein